MTSIRKMTESDLDAIAQLDVLAFSEHDQLTGKILPIPPRTRQNLLASFNLYPSGCFVAETDKLLGYLFSRIWGKVSWIGVFGVDPAHQCQNVGQRLLTAGVNGLKEAGCQIIGLETRSDKTYNIGFYTGRGFRLTFPTLGMSKAVSPPADPAAHVSWTALKETDAVRAISRISETVQSGLDYAPEAKNASAYGWGDTLFFGWPEPWAFAVIRTAHRREMKSSKVCEIDALAIHPDYTERFEKVLQAVERLAIEQNAPRLQLSINTIDGDSLKQVLDYGFRVDSVMVRMTLDRQIHQPSKGIDLSRWAM